MNEYIKTKKIGNFALVEFFHPSHNSLHSKMLNDLSDVINDLSENDTISCILLQSGGNRTFCAGANFDEMKAIKDIKTGKKFFSGFGNLINVMKNSSKLIIGRIQGKAVGGGVGIISACDICFASKYASIRLSELAIGIGPFVIAPAVERKIGVSAFAELSLKPKTWKDANWAKEKGLFSEVFETTDELDNYVLNYVDEISNFNKDAIEELKHILWHDTENWEELMEKRAEISGKLVLKLKL